MAVPSASPCPAQAAPGDCDGDLLWEGAFALSVPPWEERGGLLGTCGRSELQLLPAVAVSLSVSAV